MATMEKNNTDPETNEQTTVPEETNQVNEESTEQLEAPGESSAQVVQVKKQSGGGLSLLFSLLALGATGYLYYQQWQSSATPKASNLSGQLQPLADANQVLATDLTNLNVDVKQLNGELTTLRQQVQDLAAQLAQRPQPATVGPAEFDNSANMAALQALSQQLTAQQSRIEQLQQQLAAQLNQAPATSQSQPLSTVDHGLLWDQQAALLALDQVSLWVTGNQPDKARQVVNDFVTQPPTDAQIAGLMTALNQTLQTVNEPDVQGLRQQLAALKQAVEQLRLASNEAVSTEAKWYEQLISVKKIAEDQSTVQSSLQLMTLKANLTQLLNQAEWSLLMHDQSGWQNHLSEARQLLEQKLPAAQHILEQLGDLAAQQVSVIWPDELNLPALKTTIKGLQP
ncbi:uroporphyrinogen-III C-methyltransferase [Marinicella sediminis]|nr:uroporphyrinogen-III C-methyltransferase [Marinicella sediminis]